MMLFFSFNRIKFDFRPQKYNKILKRPNKFAKNAYFFAYLLLCDKYNIPFAIFVNLLCVVTRCLTTPCHALHHTLPRPASHAVTPCITRCHALHHTPSRPASHAVTPCITRYNICSCCTRNICLPPHYNLHSPHPYRLNSKKRRKKLEKKTKRTRKKDEKNSKKRRKKLEKNTKTIREANGKKAGF